MISKKDFDEANAILKSVEPGGSPVEQAIEFTRIERPKYVAEVGKRDGNLIFHFWPRDREMLKTFGDKLGDAMLAAFKFPERISAKHDEVMRCFQGEETAKPGDILCRFWGEPEEFFDGERHLCPNCNSSDVRVTQSSWAVRVTGYADNPLADDLIGKVFGHLETAL